MCRKPTDPEYQEERKRGSQASIAEKHMRPNDAENIAPVLIFLLLPLHLQKHVWGLESFPFLLAAARRLAKVSVCCFACHFCSSLYGIKCFRPERIG